MALYSGLFNSKNGDRKYDAVWLARYFSRFVGNGVFANPSTGLQVTSVGGMQLHVLAGDGWINGYYLYNDSSHLLQISPADGSLGRIDRVVMRLDYADRQIKLEVKKGTPSATPTPPALQRDINAYELSLADILVNRGVIAVTQAYITDTRLNSAVCGVVTSLIDQVDTTAIFNQYLVWLAEQKTDYEANYVNWRNGTNSDYQNWLNTRRQNFDSWFATLQTTLSGDVAANLQNQIQQLQTRQFGGRNLLPNTSENWSVISTSRATGVVVGVLLLSSVGLEAGDELTFALDIKTTSGKVLRARVDAFNNVSTNAAYSIGSYRGEPRISNGTGRSIVTFVIPEGTISMRMYIDANQTQTSHDFVSDELIRRTKLERGAVPTDWSPSFDDKLDVSKFVKATGTEAQQGVDDTKFITSVSLLASKRFKISNDPNLNNYSLPGRYSFSSALGVLIDAPSDFGSSTTTYLEVLARSTDDVPFQILTQPHRNRVWTRGKVSSASNAEWLNWESTAYQSQVYDKVKAQATAPTSVIPPGQFVGVYT